MRATLLALGLLLGTGMTNAAKLYTITVKTSQVVDGVAITAIPVSAPAGIKQVTKIGSAVSFRLPAGKYTFSASAFVGGAGVFKDSQKTVNIVTDGTITLPIVLTQTQRPAPVADPLRPASGDGSDLPTQAVQAWQSLAIATQATQDRCGDVPDTTHLCAFASMDFSLFKQYVASKSEFQQTTPWAPLSDGYTGQFTVYGLGSIIAVQQFQGGRVYFIFGQFP